MRVVQGKEPTHFTAMFGGKMTVFQVHMIINIFLWEHVSCPRVGMLPPLMEKKVKTLGSLIPISFRFVM